MIFYFFAIVYRRGIFIHWLLVLIFDPDLLARLKSSRKWCGKKLMCGVLMNSVVFSLVWKRDLFQSRFSCEFVTFAPWIPQWCWFLTLSCAFHFFLSSFHSCAPHLRPFVCGFWIYRKKKCERSTNEEFIWLVFARAKGNSLHGG